MNEISRRQAECFYNIIDDLEEKRTMEYFRKVGLRDNWFDEIMNSHNPKEAKYLVLVDWKSKCGRFNDEMGGILKLALHEMNTATDGENPVIDNYLRNIGNGSLLEERKMALFIYDCIRQYTSNDDWDRLMREKFFINDSVINEYKSDHPKNPLEAKYRIVAWWRQQNSIKQFDDLVEAFTRMGVLYSEKYTPPNHPVEAPRGDVTDSSSLHSQGIDLR